jgi:thiamine-monophosphate kinase
MRENTALGPGGEFDKIRGIWRSLGSQAEGLGDDCAILEVGGARLAVSCDLSVEGTHFRLGWLSPREMGYRACAAALSDLAAVAATPAGVLASLGVNPEWPDEWTADVMAGVAAAAASVGAAVWGGDLVRHTTLLVDVCVVGVLDGAPLLRRGAAPGDAVWVTGRLGGPHAALAAWRSGREPEASARERFAAPQPRVAAARWLRERGAKALIDLSDGIVGDAGHLAAASGVAITLDADRLPVHPGAEPADALRGGEEYELLVALPASFAGAADFERDVNLPLTRIGSVSAGTGVTLRDGGKPIALPETFRHF